MPSRRPRRRDAELTRRKLMDAGLRAFARKGLAGTNLHPDILVPSGVSTGSFYHQFENKRDLFVAIVEDHSTRFRERLGAVLAPRPGAGFEDIARDCYRFVLDVADQEGDYLRIQRRERDSDDPQVAKYLKNNYERWVEALSEAYKRLAAQRRDDVDVELAVRLVIGLGLTVMDDYLELTERERKLERRRLLDGLVKFTAGGMPALTRSRKRTRKAKPGPPA